MRDIITMHFAEARMRDTNAPDVEESYRDIRMGVVEGGFVPILMDTDWDRGTYFFFDSVEEMQTFAGTCPQELDSDTWVEEMEVEYVTVHWSVPAERKLEMLREQLMIMSAAYGDKRTDVTDIIEDILDYKAFDPEKVKHRFASMKLLDTDSVIVYDTCTTLFTLLHKEGYLLVGSSAIDHSYGDSWDELNVPKPPEDEISIKWGVDDVLEVRPLLTRDEAREVLQLAERRHDANVGICWEVLECHADYLFENKTTRDCPTCQSENITGTDDALVCEDCTRLAECEKCAALDEAGTSREDIADFHERNHDV